MSNDETPNPENEIIFIIDDVLKDGIIYYDSFVKRSKTKQQMESYRGIKRALEQANKQIVNLGIRNGVKSLKLYQKSVLDKLKLKQSTNQSFDAGLYRGYKEAIKKIEELAWPLFEGKGFTKDFQKEFESETITFDLEECRNCGRKWSAWTKDTLEYCKRCDEIICNHCKPEDDCEWCFTSGAVERKRAESSSKDMECPPATQDVAINTKNRNATIDSFGYGPLNVDEPDDFWEEIAEQWKTSVEAAKKSKCGNCVAFDRSPRMKDCMPGETSDGEGVLGYCWMHHFKCHSARTCDTWAKGGPITTDKVSTGWQERAFAKPKASKIATEANKDTAKAAEENQLKKAYDEGLKQLEDIGWEVNEKQFTMDAVFAGQEETHTWEISASEEMMKRYGDGQNLNQKAVRERVYESLKQAGWDMYFDESMASFGFTEFHMGSHTPSGIDRGYEDNFENMGMINQAESFGAESLPQTLEDCKKRLEIAEEVLSMSDAVQTYNKYLLQEMGIDRYADDELDSESFDADGKDGDMNAKVYFFHKGDEINFEVKNSKDINKIVKEIKSKVNYYPNTFDIEVIEGEYLNYHTYIKQPSNTNKVNYILKKEEPVLKRGKRGAKGMRMGLLAESFEALDYELNRDDCCEVWVEKLYDDGKIGFGQAGNLLVGIEKGELKCSQLGSAKCNKNTESFAAEGNKMKAAILRGIQAAIREEYVQFDGKADIAATVNMILRELGQLEGDTPVEMLDVGSAPAMRIDPYDVVAAMARAANQMAKINEESMVCWDMEDMFLDGDTKRLGWGLQSIFGIHALKAKVDGEDAWRVAGYPQAIETWFMLYNSLRINLQKEIKRVKKAEREAFYQAFARQIRANPNVQKMIKKNSKNRERAKELSKNCFPAPESKKWVPVEEGIVSKAKKLSDALNPFASETFNNTNHSNKDMDGLKTRKSGRFNSGDVKVLTIGVLIGAFGSLFGNFLTKKYLGPSVIVTTDNDDDESQSENSSTVKESDLISFSQNNRFIQTN